MSNVIYLKRALARPASSAYLPPGSFPLSAPGNCDAGLSSGETPDAATGGTGHPPSVAASSLSQPQSSGLEVRFEEYHLFLLLMLSCLLVAILTVVLL